MHTFILGRPGREGAGALRAEREAQAPALREYLRIYKYT